MALNQHSTSDPWPIGTKIKGRYEVLDIKYGGLATVYLCFDHEFQTHIAVKTFQHVFQRERSVTDRFLREAELWMRLEKHQNIVWAKWVDNINNRPCIFMEYMPMVIGFGSDLGCWIGKEELSMSLSISFGIQICTGMIYAQRKFSQMDRPFVHRDLKPANIMITAEGTAKVTDFGLSKAFSGLDETQEGKLFNGEGKFLSTKVGEIFGTPPYMAPEQWISSHNLNILADIYSFGCILYEMLIGRPPFVVEDIKKYRSRHLCESPKQLRRINEDVPENLDKLVMKCLKKKPGNRYQSFEEIRNELNSVFYRLTGNWLEYSDKPEVMNNADLSNIAMSLHELGMSEEALEYYDRLLAQIADSISPDMVARVFNNRGNCHSSLHNDDKALANYDLAARIDETYDFPWHNAAGIYNTMGDYKKALRYAEQAIELNPNYPDSHSRRADILIQLGRYQEAIEECGKAIALDPSHAWAYQSRARAYVGIGDKRNADSDNRIAKKLRGI